MASAKLTADGHLEIQVTPNGQTMQISKSDAAELLAAITDFATPAPAPEKKGK